MFKSIKLKTINKKAVGCIVFIHSICLIFHKLFNNFQKIRLDVEFDTSLKNQNNNKQKAKKKIFRVKFFKTGTHFNFKTPEMIEIPVKSDNNDTLNL